MPYIYGILSYYVSLLASCFIFYFYVRSSTPYCIFYVVVVVVLCCCGLVVGCVGSGLDPKMKRQQTQQEKAAAQDPGSDLEQGWGCLNNKYQYILQ